MMPTQPVHKHSINTWYQDTLIVSWPQCLKRSSPCSCVAHLHTCPVEWYTRGSAFQQINTPVQGNDSRVTYCIAHMHSVPFWTITSVGDKVVIGWDQVKCASNSLVIFSVRDVSAIWQHPPTKLSDFFLQGILTVLWILFDLLLQIKGLGVVSCKCFHL